MEQKIQKLLNQIYPIEIHSVESVTNEMYRCLAKEGVFFARITNHKTYNEQVGEVNWTNYLYNQGVGVSPTITSLNNKVIESIFLDKEKFVVLFKAARGAHLPKHKWNEAVLKDLGRLIGKMHRVSKNNAKSESVNYIHDWYQNEEYEFLKYIPNEETMIRDKVEGVLTAIKNLPQSESTYGLVHGDLWLENILVDKEMKLNMVDFQDCEKHFYVFDLAVPIYSALEYSFTGKGNITEYGRSITSALIEGYREENIISSEMLDKLPLFIKLKEIFEYSLMYMYWDQEKLSEEQFRIMNHFRMRIEYNHSVMDWSEFNG